MKRLLKWLGTIVVGIVGIIVLASVVLFVLSERRVNETFDDLPEVSLVVPSDSATIARGMHIATIRGCVDCHSADLGGKLFLDEPPIGRIYSSNLTSGRGGVGATYQIADWDHAIRHGVDPTGRPLWVMPSVEYSILSDEDVAAVIAYLRSLPPVDREKGTARLGPLGRTLLVLGKIPLLNAEKIDHRGPRPAAPPEGPTAEYGAYLAASCVGCHGSTFRGGPIPGMPPSFPHAANITPDPTAGIGSWTEGDFFHALREGRRPDGTSIKVEMPWALTARMTDDEIRAIWAYLRTVPVT